MSQVQSATGVSVDPSEEIIYECTCGGFFFDPTENFLKAHVKSKLHRITFISHSERKFIYNVRLGHSSFKNNLGEYIVDLQESKAQSPEEVLEECKETIKEIWEFELKNHGTMKAQLRLSAIHENPVKFLNLPENEEPEPHNFMELREMQPKYTVCVPSTDFEKFFEEQKDSTVEKVENMEEKGSGWSFESFSHLTVSFAKDEIVSGSSYFKEPKCISSRKATINIQNTDHL